jgi:transposase
LERLQDEGYRGGISIVKDYVKVRRPPALKVAPAVKRYETKPGRQAQMDWGTMKYQDLDGEIRKVAVFVMVLGFSRACYIEFGRRCDLASLLRSLVHAFEYFGGVPQVVLTDHMKTVISSSDQGKPVWQEGFERFATEAGFVPRVCRVRRPQTKGKVERLVHYVRDNFMPGRRFTDFGDLQAQALSWCDRVNQRRHATTGERPMLQLVQERLKPLPASGILEAYRWEIRKVDRECFVSFNGTKYGVQWRYCGREVKVAQLKEEILVVDADGVVVERHRVCYRSRRHIYAKDQYEGLDAAQGIPYQQPIGQRIRVEDVEVRSLAVYEAFAEVI